jgi:hypothetical protein
MHVSSLGWLHRPNFKHKYDARFNSPAGYLSYGLKYSTQYVVSNIISRGEKKKKFCLHAYQHADDIYCYVRLFPYDNVPESHCHKEGRQGITENWPRARTIFCRPGIGIVNSNHNRCMNVRVCLCVLFLCRHVLTDALRRKASSSEEA